MRKRHFALGGVALAVSLALTACADDKPEARKPSESASPTRATAPTPKTPEEKALTQLTNYLEVRDRAHRRRSIDFKTLNPVATGEEFLELQEAVIDMQQADVTKTGSYVHRLSQPQGRGNSIEVTDCEDRSGVVVKVKGNVRRPDYTDPNGNPLRNPAPVTYTLIKDEGAWKVSESDLRWNESC